MKKGKKIGKKFDTRSTLDLQSVNGRPSVSQLTFIDQRLVECQPMCLWTIDRRYQSRVSIDTQMWKVLVHMIQI